ncbi:MAG: 1-deoxy-D-xylulose-5-phosphate reductoisomerase [Treponema sp.]|jgi:1-deoxy-D-xylulose-5-phosphate reductoisomerase|nr:1-deoxy-D-xylulose-5-phosphate reductoisomerase [Treponema sp.]
MKKRIAILGATGSIGKSALEVIRRGSGDFETVLLSAQTNITALKELGKEFPGALLALSGPEPEAPEAEGLSFFGPQGLLRAIAGARVDITVNGISGAAGLRPSLAAIDSGSDLALANKETVVMAGPEVFALAREKKVKILPVDSEHSAIFHLIEAHGADRVEEILLTASGGPFRKMPLAAMKDVTAKEALAHPTWNMGPKITVDSASLANKGLEVIEAARLFNMPPEKISVLVHPQSVVHSLVRMKDGAVYAQLSRPDMRLPIHEALHWPETRPSPFGALDFRGLSLEFEAPDTERFPMLSLAYEAVRRGGFYPCVYNGANEEAAAAFLAGRIGFLDIPRIVEYVLNRGFRPPESAPDQGGDFANKIEAVLAADKAARELAGAFIASIQK